MASHKFLILGVIFVLASASCTIIGAYYHNRIVTVLGIALLIIGILVSFVSKKCGRDNKEISDKDQIIKENG